MIDKRSFPIVGCFFAAVLCFGQAQSGPANPQQPKPTTGTTAQTTGQLPPPSSPTTGQLPPPNTTGTPPPPSTTGTLTPPIMPQTTVVQTPPNLSISGPPAPTPGVPNRPLTAQEAAEIALMNQPSVAIAKAQVQAARGQANTQRAALYPQLSLNENYSKSDTFVSENNNNNGNTTGTTAGTTGTTAGTTGTTAGTTGTTSGTTGTTAGTTGTTSGTTGNTTTTTTTTGGGGGTNFFGGGGRGQGFSGGVTLNQLIFDFNHTRDLVSQAEAEERAARHGYTKAQIDTILQVKQAFYTFVQNEGLVSVQQANVTAAQASLNLAQAQVAAGLGAPADVVSATTTLDTALQALVQARMTALTSRTQLCFDMGIDPRTPLVTANSAEPAEPTTDLNTLVDQAVLNRPDILQQIETLRAAGYSVSAARTQNAPQVNFQLSVNNSGGTNPFATDSLSPGVNLVWVFEDAGATAGRVETAHANQDIARQQLQLTTQAAIQDVSAQSIAVQAAEQRVTVANGEVANATQNVKLAQGQYAAGVTPFVTVITAQAQLVQAQADQVNATANLSQTRAALRHSLGLGI